MSTFNYKDHPHRRYNPLLGEWVLVSPQRSKRPWQGQQEVINNEPLPTHDPKCYLCAGNQRINGDINANYKGVYVFDNDFGALQKEEIEWIPEETDSDDFFKLKPERGINRVVCFSENHGLTIPEMSVDDLIKVVEVWQNEFRTLGALDYINHVQIFENKGSTMGCSNPHPHGQIWSQSSIPTLVAKTQDNLQKYYQKHQTSLLADYLKKELQSGERVVFENEHFVSLVPFWAVWPYETMIVSKRHIRNILELNEEEKTAFAEILKINTVKYDNLFQVSFPYSAGIHQAPTDGEEHAEWHFHMMFYPPLLRSATVKKFMVGYELLAEAQRDITPEQSAQILNDLPLAHFKNRN